MSWAEVKAGQVVRILNGAQAVEKDGIKHSANIFTNWTKEQLKNIGYYPYRVVKEQADSRFYSIGSTSHTITNDNTEVVGTVKAIAKDIAEIKKGYLNVVNQRAYGLLHPTDWQVVKAKELGTDVDSKITTFRSAVRSKCNELETALNTDSDIDGIKAIIDSPGTDANDDMIPAPINNWPELEE